MNLKKLAFACVGIFRLEASLSIENPSEPLNIALSSTFGGRSHIKYLLQIAQHLRNRGHNIIYAAPQGNFKFNKPYNYTEYDVGDSNESSRDLMKTVSIEEKIEKSTKIMQNYLTKVTIDQYKLSFINYEKLYKYHKIDLIICDFFASVCLDSARKNNVPVIVGFQGLNFGIATAPFITNTMDSSPTTAESLTFYQRLKQGIIDPLERIYTFSGMTRQMNQVREKFGVPPSPNPFGAFDKVMKISNTYIGFDEPRPISNTLKLIGPVMDNHISQLDERLQTFLDTHKTLYVAFGSNVVLNVKLLHKLVAAMHLAIENKAVDAVIWGLGNTNPEDIPKVYEVNGQKYSTESFLDGSHPYIKALKWAPQTPILNHPNTKLFISHGGIESSHEGIHSGTPILVVPIFGDQHRNGRFIQNRGIGDFVNTLEVTSYELFNKIKELTREDNYVLQDNVKHIQAISHDRNAMRESNASFLEHYALSAKICRKFQTPKPFGIPCELQPYMQADSRMPFITAYKIDILLALFTIGFLVITISSYVVYRLINLFVQNHKKVIMKHD